MVTLREFSKVFWTITRLSVTGRTPDSRFIHKWLWGPDIQPSIHQEYDVKQGELTINHIKINAHCGTDKRGLVEMGWGLKTELFSDLILDAPITHMLVTPIKGGHEVYIDVKLDQLKAMCLLEQEKEEKK